MPAERWSKASAALVRRAVRPASRADPTRLPADLAEAAAWHGVTGYVRQMLARGGTDLERLVHLDRTCRTVARSHLWTLGDLRVVQERFVAAGLPFAVVKGPVVAETLHGAATLRGYGDLDVLVSPSDLPRALTILVDAGAAVLDRNWGLLARECRGEVHLRTVRGTVIDLHWHVINDANVRRYLRIDTDELLDRRVTVPVGPWEVPTTGAVDTLLHLAVHATISGGDRLVWFKDLERAVVHPPPWDTVVDRAQAWGVEPLVGHALLLTRHLTGAAIPAAVLGALVPSRTWRRIVTAVAAASPPERAAGGGSLHRMLGRSTRSDLPTTLRELSRRSVGHALRRERRLFPNGRFDPTEPGSVLWPAGAPVDYLAAVGAETARPR